MEARQNIIAVEEFEGKYKINEKHVRNNRPILSQLVAGTVCSYGHVSLDFCAAHPGDHVYHCLHGDVVCEDRRSGVEENY